MLKEARMNFHLFSTNSVDDNGIIKSNIKQNITLKVLRFSWYISCDKLSLSIDNLYKTLNNCKDITKINN